jgi:predicted Rossmann fold flavoprotein
MAHTAKILVIGAGPSGLMAAAVAAAKGLQVTVFEQLSRPGLKLLATGGGKCNLTNVLPVEYLCENFGRQWRFTLPAVYLMPPEELREFFELRGVPTTTEDGFHVFPKSQKASDVLNALLKECERLGVEFKTSCKITSLTIENGVLKGVIADSQLIPADRIILATGGKGYPKLGGKGIGYILAEQAGHKIIAPLPAMTGLKTVENWPGECTGISFKSATVTIDLPKYRNRSTNGELLFTHNGISGPAAIDWAGDISQLLQKHSSIPIKINLFSELTADDWKQKFNQWQEQHGKKHLLKLLSQVMPRAIAENLCLIAGNIGNTKAAEFTAASREKLATLLTSLPLAVKTTEGWDKAMVTRGGVSLKKVNPENLESRLVKGLFFAGEVLDIDGPCGGYNLQWAFSSGALAGQSAAD